MSSVAGPRLLVHVEGQTELLFVRELLAPHLRDIGYSTVVARLIGGAWAISARGGIKSWPDARNGIVRHLTNDSSAIASTMVDFYGMPKSGTGAWPGRAEALTNSYLGNAELVESAMAADIGNHVSGRFDRRRFIPFVMMHEFEAILFSDCSKFGSAIDRPDAVGGLSAIRGSFESPEAINDDINTAPSTRIKQLIPEIEKPLHGNIAAIEIGLDRIRAECLHFSAWLAKLESRV